MPSAPQLPTASRLVHSNAGDAFSRLIAGMRGVGWEISGEELADALWLTRTLHFESSDTTQDSKSESSSSSTPQNSEQTTQDPRHSSIPTDSPTSIPGGSAGKHPGDATLGIPSVAKPDSGLSLGTASGLTLRTPAGRALPGARELARAHRPFRRRVPSPTRRVFDEDETIRRIADEQLWAIVERPARERWLDLCLVVDDSPTMILWQESVRELRRCFERAGMFRDVRIWSLDTANRDPVLRATPRTASRLPGELLTSNSRRLIVIVSDTLGPAWREPGVARMLDLWGRNQILALAHLLPERLWDRTPLATATRLRVSPPFAGASNRNLLRHPWQPWDSSPSNSGLAVPVFSLNPPFTNATTWSRVVAGDRRARTAALLFPTIPTPSPTPAQPPPQTARELVDVYHAHASTHAWRLAQLMASAPLRLSVMRVIQSALLPDSGQAHLAEFLFSDLLVRSTHQPVSNDPDAVDYDFRPGIRDILLRSSNTSETLRVQTTVGDYVRNRYGAETGFAAILANPLGAKVDTTLGTHPDTALFAQIAGEMLHRLGGSIATAAQNTFGMDLKSAPPKPSARDSSPPAGLAVDPALQPPPARPLTGKRLLWVDDEPKGNQRFVRDLTQLGAEIVEVNSTSTALKSLSSTEPSLPFDAILSDLRRGKSPREGLSMLKELRQRGWNLPVGFFSWAQGPKLESEALKLGAFVCTNLFHEVKRRLIEVLDPAQTLAQELSEKLESEADQPDEGRAEMESGVPPSSIASFDLIASVIALPRWHRLSLVVRAVQRLLSRPIHPAISENVRRLRPRLAALELAACLARPVANFEGDASTPGPLDPLALALLNLAELAAGESIPLIPSADSVSRSLNVLKTAIPEVDTRWASQFKRLFREDLQQLQALIQTAGRMAGEPMANTTPFNPITLGDLWRKENDVLRISPTLTEASHSPSYWILIAGLGDTSLPHEFRELCTRLGTLLAAAGYGLIAGGWPGVDTTVTEAFVNRLAIERRRPEKWLRLILEPGRKPGMEYTSIETTSSVEESIQRSVSAANAVILVSGRGGTARIGRAALNAGKLVLPIRATGGDAESLFSKARSAAARGPFSIPAKEFDATLGATWEKALLQLPFLLEQVSLTDTIHLPESASLGLESA